MRWRPAALRDVRHPADLQRAERELAIDRPTGRVGRLRDDVLERDPEREELAHHVRQTGLPGEVAREHVDARGDDVAEESRVDVLPLMSC